MRFSDTSKERLATCHRDLQTVMNRAIEITDIDFGIACGRRTVQEQIKLYEQKKSQLDGITKKSKHNYEPSRAVDIFAYVDGKANYSEKNMAYLAGVILTVAKQLYRKGRITHQIRCGGNWGVWRNGMDYHGFIDLPHFEII